ncbi:unnamed protein product [Caenorhabditis sp. 36 PRJEB53466]|nr:unnamed protein product [Caenorhabditis sp. 36 PRJEB53466]
MSDSMALYGWNPSMGPFGAIRDSEAANEPSRVKRYGGWGRYGGRGGGYGGGRRYYGGGRGGGGWGRGGGWGGRRYGGWGK